MDIDALKEIFSGLDPQALIEKLIPKLDAVLSWIAPLVRMAVMVAPLLILGFGLLYLLTPPKEANYSSGYRFWWGMSSLDAWRFTQKVAGMTWSCLGLILTVVMALRCVSLAGMQLMDMLGAAGKCLVQELGWVLFSCLVIDIIVIVVFDRRGYRRREPVE